MTEHRSRVTHRSTPIARALLGKSASFAFCLEPPTESTGIGVSVFFERDGVSQWLARTGVDDLRTLATVADVAAAEIGARSKENR